jgi:hypothetical protein
MAIEFLKDVSPREDGSAAASGMGHATKAGPEGTGQLIRAYRCSAIAMREKYANAPRSVNESAGKAPIISSRSKDFAGFLAIDGDLRLQGIEPGEALLGP